MNYHSKVRNWRKCEVRPCPRYGPYWRESNLSEPPSSPFCEPHSPARVLRDAQTHGTSHASINFLHPALNFQHPATIRTPESSCSSRRGDPQALIVWRERNRHALREFWARAPADALELEKALAPDGKPAT